MPPRDKPAKKLGGAEKKAEAAEEKSRAAQQVANKKEDDEWSKGAKGKGNKEDKAAKEEDARARKAESARLLALEEAAAPKVKAAPVKKAAAKAPVKVVPAKIPSFEDGIEDDEPTQFGASGIDDALAMLDFVNEKQDKASVGQKAAKLESHPERRFKAAFEAYKTEQLPIIKKDQPGMRLVQYENQLYKDFQKSPLNPFNQVTMAYDATKEEKVEKLKQVREETARRLRQD